jgi:perosamine synthetase
MERLFESGIETRPVFYPMHVLPPYRDSAVNHPVAERLCARGISLPSHGLLTHDDVEYIAERITAICGA